MPLAERHAKFKTFPYDQQVDIYLESFRHQPGDYGFGYELAEGKGRALPAIMARLRVEKSEAAQADLLVVLQYMVAPLGFQFDAATAAEVAAIVAQMRIESFRRKGDMAVATIETSVQ